MKKNLLILLLILPAWAQETPLSSETLELERKRLELEKGWLELETERLALEKQKYQDEQGWLELETERLALEKQKYQDEQGEYIVEYEEIIELDDNTSRPKRKRYVGADFAFAGSGHRILTLNGNEHKERISTTGMGIKLGFGAQDENRIELFYHQKHYRFDEASDDWYVALYGIDYLFVFYEVMEKRLSPYLKVGYTIAESDSYIHTLKALGYTVDSKNSTTSGTGYRLGFGAFYQINEKIEASLGFDYVMIHWNKVMLLSGGTYEEMNIDDEVETFFVNVNYNF